jgi:hypothetical protein
MRNESIANQPILNEAQIRAAELELIERSNNPLLTTGERIALLGQGSAKDVLRRQIRTRRYP